MKRGTPMSNSESRKRHTARSERVVKPHTRAFLSGDLTALGIFLIGCTSIYGGHRLRTWGRP